MGDCFESFQPKVEMIVQCTRNFCFRPQNAQACGNLGCFHATNSLIYLRRRASTLCQEGIT